MFPIIILAIAAVAAMNRGGNSYPVIPGTSGAATGPFLTWRNGINSQPGRMVGGNSFALSFNPTNVTPMNKQNPYKFN